VKNPLKVPLFAALDVDESHVAMSLAQKLAPYVGGFKVGPRLVMRYGDQFIHDLAALGPIFVDNKYHDIPSVVEHSVRATFAAGASFCTVHAAIGMPAMKRLYEVEEELNQQRYFKILAVTVLTSFSENELPVNWMNVSLFDHVKMLAETVVESGLTGLVCSAHEVTQLKEMFPQLYLVTPGIRFLNEGQGDQKRVMSPQKALAAGASALVVGRPLCQASDPVAAAKSYFAALKPS